MAPSDSRTVMTFNAHGTAIIVMSLVWDVFCLLCWHSMNYECNLMKLRWIAITTCLFERDEQIKAQCNLNVLANRNGKMRSTGHWKLLDQTHREFTCTQWSLRHVSTNRTLEHAQSVLRIHRPASSTASKWVALSRSGAMPFTHGLSTNNKRQLSSMHAILQKRSRVNEWNRSPAASLNSFSLSHCRDSSRRIKRETSIDFGFTKAYAFYLRLNTKNS